MGRGAHSGGSSLREVGRERVLAEALGAVDEGVTVQQADGTLRVVNERAAQLMGVQARAVLDRPASLLPVQVRTEEGQVVSPAVALGARVFRTHEPARRLIFQIARPDGSYTWIQASHRPLWHSDGQLWGVAATCVEITDQWERTRQLAYLATHDVLTRLPNRWEFESQLEPALARAARNGGAVAVLFMDVDEFKPVNDQLGHAAGDDLLRRIAERLRAVVRGGDLLCRYGGDEFVALIPDLPLRSAGEAAERLTKRIGLAMADSFEVDGTRRHVSISVGSAIFPLDAPDATGLLLRADTEMYRHKRQAW